MFEWILLAQSMLNKATLIGKNQVETAVLVNAINNKGRRNLSELTITQKDTGKSFKIQRGDRVVIHLAENPTTGYRWAVEEADEKLIPLQDSSLSLPPNAGLGSGGRRTFTFHSQSAGTAHIQLKLWRDWEGDNSITDRFDVTIHIHN